jgi:3-oxoacyl-[acyl-carrier protein] reductase
MAKRSQARVVLVTGGMSDIGRATARAFARAGNAIVLNYRRPSKALAGFSDSLLHDEGASRVLPIQADVRSRAEVAALFEQAYQTLGEVDVLVNNAGVNRDRPFLEMSDEDWRTVLDTILDGAFLCSQEFARRFRGTDGNIVNIGAITGLRARKNGANYCSARAALLALTKCMALELAPAIRVNIVTPGRIQTEELRTRYGLDDPATLARMEQEVPLKRLGQPEDVARTIRFLTDSGQYVTGQNFIVDGGLFLH